MKVYLDLVFFLNLFFDYLLLYSTGKLLKEVISIKRILLGSLIGSLTTFLLFVPMNSLIFFITKVIISSCMIIISFGKKSFLKKIGQFYINSIILGGGLYLVDVNHEIDDVFINFIFIIFIGLVLMLVYIKDKKKNDFNNKFIYHTDIYINKKVYTLKSILDTGNSLVDPYKKRSVLIVNSSIKMVLPKKFIYVSYKALNNTGVIKCYIVDKVVINKREFYDCLIGISNDELNIDNVNCILPGKFKEEL